MLRDPADADPSAAHHSLQRKRPPIVKFGSIEDRDNKLLVQSAISKTNCLQRRRFCAKLRQARHPGEISLYTMAYLSRAFGLRASVKLKSK